MEVEKNLFSIFSNFIRDLSKTYPEIKSCLYRNYEDCLINENKSLSEFPKLINFLELIDEYEKYIMDKNLEFFDLEVELLENISFKNLWEKNISNKTRETIWKYLQTFQIININLKSNEQLKEALNKIGKDTTMEVDKKTVKDLKKLKKLSDDIKKEKGEDELDELDEMFDGLMDTGIGEIAKEVAKNINVEDIFGNINENSNPMDLMTKMMDPEKMGAIFNNINTVMEKKVEKGEVTKDSLKGEAEGMMNKMSDNPLFSGMMNKMKDEGDTNEETKSEEKELSREEKQKRLREKINEKKNNR
tara:strand:- start:146 stop:1054 length:909 start_codon:yes stop_codon:yes gene_type:complete